jgi:hypothetical protein
MAQDPGFPPVVLGSKTSMDATVDVKFPVGDISPITDDLPVVPSTDGSACANCGSAQTGLFCAMCGQRERRARLSVRLVASDVISRLTSADTGFIHTAVRLTLAPGEVVRDFIGGRTVIYTHPFGYLIFAFAAFAILSGVFGGTTGTGGASNRLFIALIIPFMALMARGVFWRGDLNYAEHLIAAGYVIAHVALFLGLLQAAVPLVSGSPEGPAAYALFFGALGVGVGYVAWAYSRIFAARPLLSAAGGLLSLAGGIALWSVFMMALLHLIRG